MNDLVSVIMPSYNTAQYIAASIQSVIDQTYTNWELIIVDDCSTDETDAVVHPFLTDPRIRYLKNGANAGAALTRNRALREAKGRWIAFLDSDDLWLPEKLEKQIGFMEENGYAFSFTDYRIQLNGTWSSYICTGPDVVTKRKLYDYCYFSTITVIYDQRVVGLIQISDLKKNNDYAMWFHAVEKTICYRFPECLSYYIKHENSVSSGRKFKLIKHFYYLYRQELSKSKLTAVILSLNNLFHGVIKKYKYRRTI